ncbi:MAG: NAD(P)H-dependent oxidoreductase, partial [bacterium]|nr:NAD(P)H-dependent oxidoreductase [bacterium]
NWRYAVKVFDPNKKISAENLHTILESARLSPSSNGVEMWKFFVIENPEIRKRLREVGYDQPKITDASHLIVIAYRTDSAENLVKERLERTAKIQNKKIEELEGLKNMLESGLNKKIKNGTLESWVMSQAYIPLGIMIETASLLHIDNGPMEGFDPNKVDEILGLKEKNLKSVTMLALGYRDEDPASTRPKVRRPFDEVVEFV